MVIDGTIANGRKLTDDPEARSLVRETHARMYKWPKEFGGYRANVTFNQNGTIVQGMVKLVPRKDTTVDLPGADPALQEWVSDRLWMQGMHLAYLPFEDGDGRYILSFDPEEDAGSAHPRGRRVLLTGGRLESWYRIKNQQYTQIGRITPMTERRVNTIERYDSTSDGRQVSSHYVMTYFSLDGQSVIGMESYVNEFIEVAGICVPAVRRVSFGESGRVSTRIIILSNHEVME